MICNTLTCGKYDEKKWGMEDRSSICDDGPLHRQISYEQILGWDISTVPLDSVQKEVVTIGTTPFLKTMWTLLWTTFRHPFTDTVIDATTGDIIRNQ